MKQPEGFVEEGKEHLVCRLKQSLYGLKQSHRCWNSMLDTHLKDMGERDLALSPQSIATCSHVKINV